MLCTLLFLKQARLFFNSIYTWASDWHYGRHCWCLYSFSDSLSSVWLCKLDILYVLKILLSLCHFSILVTAKSLSSKCKHIFEKVWLVNIFEKRKCLKKLLHGFQMFTGNILYIFFNPLSVLGPHWSCSDTSGCWVYEAQVFKGLHPVSWLCLGLQKGFDQS